MKKVVQEGKGRSIQHHSMLVFSCLFHKHAFYLVAVLGSV